MSRLASGALILGLLLTAIGVTLQYIETSAGSYPAFGADATVTVALITSAAGIVTSLISAVALVLTHRREPTTAPQVINIYYEGYPPTPAPPPGQPGGRHAQPPIPPPRD